MATIIDQYGNPIDRKVLSDYVGVDCETFGCMSVREQVDAWARLTNDGYNVGVVKRLIEMGVFDGQKVDAGFIASCIQLGVGNCQARLTSRRCCGFADSNGTTICDMAKSARANADPNCKEGSNPAACDQGPGDFPGSQPVAAVPPAPASTDIVLGPGEI